MSEPSLYVHIPFCETKCPYCDFNSYQLEGRDVDGYLDALRREMDARGVPSRPPTLFIGGGTPTVVDPDQLDAYLRDILSRVEPDPEREFTVEANPGSLTAEKVAVLAEHGVTRVSLGAQSFFDHHLETLGRVHAAPDIETAVGFVRDGAISGLNLDFIFAIPNMTLGEWDETLAQALALAPDHLSCYALTFEPGTEFYVRRSAGRLRSADERLELAMFRLTERRLRARGFARYEISNYAPPGRECKHNLGYWRNRPYAGFGAGAFSYLAGNRLGNERGLARYAAAVKEHGHAFVSHETLTGIEAAREMIALGLRMREGVDLDEVDARYAVKTRDQYDATIARLLAARLIDNGPRLKLARRGWRLADGVAAEFF
ncbi:MAG: radical SAM family heme chaperone HemW [Planctomycetota bacterium]|nr:radical SAM family heme chaperone HemW [Planctomycetota bacterium]